MQPDSGLELMTKIAQPLDEWCQFCDVKLGVMKTADGVVACAECAPEVLKALGMYEADEAVLTEGFVKGPYYSNRAMRRAANRQTRLRNNGMKYGEARTGSRCR